VAFARARTLESVIDVRAGGPRAIEGQPRCWPLVEPLQFDSAPDASPLRRILYFDQTSWLPDNLLERGDRRRWPSGLKRECLSWTTSWPPGWRACPIVTGYAARPANGCCAKLRAACCRGRSWSAGRSASDADRPMAARTDARVPLRSPAGNQTRTARFYRPAALQRVLDEHLAGRVNHEKLLWSLLISSCGAALRGLMNGSLTWAPAAPARDGRRRDRLAHASGAELVGPAIRLRPCTPGSAGARRQRSAMGLAAAAIGRPTDQNRRQRRAGCSKERGRSSPCRMWRSGFRRPGTAIRARHPGADQLRHSIDYRRRNRVGTSSICGNSTATRSW